MAESKDSDQKVSTINTDNNQNIIDENEETKHFQKVVGAFLYYK